MKKHLILPLALVLFGACHPVSKDLRTYALNCKAIEISVQSDTLEFPYTVCFDPKGRVETVTTSDFDGSFRFGETYRYDSHGQLMEISGVNDENELEIRYEYDYAGKFIRECRAYGMNNQEMHRWVHENDGRHIVKTDYYSEGELAFTTTKSFSGHHYEEETCQSDGQVMGRASVDYFETEEKPMRIVGDDLDIEITYNEKGLPVMSRNAVLNSRGELQWAPDLEEHPLRYYRYEYDKRGNWISRADSVHPDSTAYAVLKRTISYQK